MDIIRQRGALRRARDIKAAALAKAQFQFCVQTWSIVTLSVRTPTARVVETTSVSIASYLLEIVWPGRTVWATIATFRKAAREDKKQLIRQFGQQAQRARDNGTQG
eukprot:7855254-Lingulodinium_polyedra.AAC.1